MKIAPPILSELDFFGIPMVLIEHDEHEDSWFHLKSLMEKNNIIFSSVHDFASFKNSAIVTVDSIVKVSRIIKSCQGSPVDFYIINRIDMMNTDLPRKERGVQIKAWLSMICSDKILCGATVIVTSCSYEYSIREIADKYISLRN